VFTRKIPKREEKRSMRWRQKVRGILAVALGASVTADVHGQTCALDGRGQFNNANNDVLTIGTCTDLGVDACDDSGDCTNPQKPFCDAGLCRRLTTVSCDANADCPSGDVCSGGLVSGAGATLFVDFFTFPASTNDWIDVDDDGFSGFLGFFPFVDQLSTPYVTGSDLSSHWEFQYRSVGSVRGFEEFVENQTCGTTPIDVPAERGIYNTIVFADVGNITYGGVPDNTSGTPHVPCSIQFSFLDVPGSWAVQVDGEPNWDKSPTTPGYGLNPRPTSSGALTQLQTLTRSCGFCSGTADPCTANRYCPAGQFCDFSGAPIVSLNTNTETPDELTLFDYVGAWVPVAAIANRGTGIENIKFSEMQYLLVSGRMPNGENLVGAVRDVGSGTRNAYVNSFGVDTSWGNGDAVGPRINNDVCSNLGPVPPAFVAACGGQTQTQPTNCGGSGIVENAVRNWRLAIGHTGLAGPSRAASDSAAGQYELLNTCKDVPATGQPACNCSVTGYVRPGVDTTLDNCDPCTSFQVAGAGSFVTRGNRTEPPHTVAGIENAAVRGYMNNIFDSIASFEGNVFEGECNTTTECTDTQNPCTVNSECTAGACSVTVATPCHLDEDCPVGETCVGGAACELKSCELDVDCPDVGDFCKSKLNMPGQLLATEFFLPDGLDCLHVLNEPLKYVSVPTNTDLQEFTRANSVIDVRPFGSVNPAGQSPRRNTVPGNLYTDGSDDAYIQWSGSSYSELPAARNLAQRNRVQGDFNNDGRRDVNDAAQLATATYGPRVWQTTVAATGAGSIGQQTADRAIPEVLGDFNGDGNLNKEDLRYFADGLAMVSMCSNADTVCTVNGDCPAGQTCSRHRVRLDRKRGAIAIDNAISGVGQVFPWAADPATNLVTPAVNPTSGGQPVFAVPPPVDGMFTTGKMYQPGDFRGDVAGNLAQTPAPGAWPLGWDGLINADDIDYCAQSIYNDGAGNNWANLDHAAFLDLSCDMNGDTQLNLDDIYELVVNILETSFGDLNLDGVTDGAEGAAICAICQTDPGNGDVSACSHPLCGGGLVAAVVGNCNDTQSCKWIDGDQTGDGFVTPVDLSALACNTALGAPLAESTVVSKNRFLSFTPANSGSITAIRVHLIGPGTSVRSYWVGPPQLICENSGNAFAPNPNNPPTFGCGASPGPRAFTGARLQCTPHFQDWGAVGLIDVWGPEVTPGAIYRVRHVEESCADAGFESGSVTLGVNTSAHGDILSDSSTNPPGPPNTVVDGSDIVGVLNKFRNVAGAVRKSRAELAPGTIDMLIQVNDITLVVDAFSNDPFPFGAPVACPPTP
jgi:hypothetical protein